MEVLPEPAEATTCTRLSKHASALACSGVSGLLSTLSSNSLQATNSRSMWAALSAAQAGRWSASQPDRHARFLQARSEGGWINRGAGSEKVLLLLVGEPAALLEAGPLLFCLVVQPRVYRALHALEERHVLPQALLPQHHVQRLNQGGALGVGQPVGLHFPVPPRMKRDVSPEGAGIDVVSGLVFDVEPWVRPSSAKTSSRPSKRKRQSDEPVTCRPTHDAAHSLAIIQQ